MAISGNEGASRAVDAAIKACEHFAAEIVTMNPTLTSSSSAFDEIKMAAEALIACLSMVEITKQNVQFVEGVVCQIVEPDLQQTASYLRRVGEKGHVRMAASLLRHQATLQKRAERMWNCIGALSSAADGSNGLRVEKSPAPNKDACSGTVDSRNSIHAFMVPPMPSINSMQSSVYHPAMDTSHPSHPYRPMSAPLGGQGQFAQGHDHSCPSENPASFPPQDTLQPLHTPHAYSGQLNPFHPSSPLAAFSHSSGTPVAGSNAVPFSPATHAPPIGGHPFSPIAGHPAFSSGQAHTSALAEPPMASFLQSAADAARRFRKSNSMTARISSLRPRSHSPPTPPLATAPMAFPEVFSPEGSSHSTSENVGVPVRDSSTPEFDLAMHVARSAQEELSAELARRDTTCAAAAAKPATEPVPKAEGLAQIQSDADGEFEEQMRATATALEAVSREIEQEGMEITFGKTLREAASGQDEVSREFEIQEGVNEWDATLHAAASAQDEITREIELQEPEEDRVWDGAVRAAASALDELSHELELKESVTASAAEAVGGDSLGELERRVEEVSRELEALPEVGKLGVTNASLGAGEPSWKHVEQLQVEEEDLCGS